MKILLIGSGGREHALAWKLAQSPLVSALFVAPGNPGIAKHAELVSLDVANHRDVIAFVRGAGIDLVIIGPEQPLVAGLADELEREGISVFGPSAGAAQLEGSKGFTKDLCARAGIPTAAYRRFDNAADARAYAEKTGAPLVVKADGLSAGKGVVVAESLGEAIAAIDACFEGRFGAAGAEVVIEEKLEGIEASLFALSDGETVIPFGTAQDYKRVGEGDMGPNTGGMGAISPAPALPPSLVAEAMETIVRPTVTEMRKQGTPFRGVLYAGLMVTVEGPKLIEYNVRFGDPECQVLMLRLQSDLVPILIAAASGTLAAMETLWSDATAVTVVMASKGYPGAFKRNTRIGGIEAAEACPGVQVFHAGTTRDESGILAAGGRVLNVSALGADAKQARAKAYAGVDAIDWPDGFFRKDIAASLP